MAAHMGGCHGEVTLGTLRIWVQLLPLLILAAWSQACLLSGHEGETFHSCH